MATNLRACSRCRAATQLEHLNSISGETKVLTVTVTGMPVLVCAKGHRQFLDTTFPVRLLETMVDKNEVELPAGEQKGRLFKHFYCGQCHSELQPKPEHRHTFTVDVSLPDIDAFKVDLTMAVYRCGSCGKEQLHSLREMQTNTPLALGYAFQRGEILHD